LSELISGFVFFGQDVGSGVGGGFDGLISLGVLDFSVGFLGFFG